MEKRKRLKRYALALVDVLSGGAPGRRVSRRVSLSELAGLENRLEVSDLDELIVGRPQLAGILRLGSSEDISLQLVLSGSASLGGFTSQRVRAFNEEVEDGFGLLV